MSTDTSAIYLKAKHLKKTRLPKENQTLILNEKTSQKTLATFQMHADADNFKRTFSILLDINNWIEAVQSNVTYKQSFRSRLDYELHVKITCSMTIVNAWLLQDYFPKYRSTLWWWLSYSRKRTCIYLPSFCRHYEEVYLNYWNTGT